ELLDEQTSRPGEEVPDVLHRNTKQGDERPMSFSRGAPADGKDAETALPDHLGGRISDCFRECRMFFVERCIQLLLCAEQPVLVILVVFRVAAAGEQNAFGFGMLSC